MSCFFCRKTSSKNGSLKRPIPYLLIIPIFENIYHPTSSLSPDSKIIKKAKQALIIPGKHDSGMIL
jgi:hypothetical protein